MQTLIFSPTMPQWGNFPISPLQWGFSLIPLSSGDSPGFPLYSGAVGCFSHRLIQIDSIEGGRG